MKNIIQIVTKRHPGVEGGGVEEVHYTWTLGPRNLLAAMKKLPEHEAWMEKCWGNDGAGRSRITVAGVEMTYGDFQDYRMQVEDFGMSRTAWCAQYINGVTA